jgi:ribonuclease BN (tRNA processing enzyme)
MLPSAADGSRYQFLTSFVVNDTVVVDAGAVGFNGDPDAQARIDHIFLSHSHADHICSLPTFIMNVFDRRSQSVVIHAHADVLQTLTEDVFNGRVWPDFLRIERNGSPMLALHAIANGEATSVHGLQVTGVRVNHPVPTFSYLVDDGSSVVVISTDSGPTTEIWRVASATSRLKAVFLGTSFTNDEARLAHLAGHLTSALARDEVAKIPGDVPVIAVHLKPAHHARVVEELLALEIPRLSIGEMGRDYVF